MKELLGNPLVLIAILVIGVIAFSRLSGKRMSGDEARQLVEGGAVLIDVRTPGEFSAGHIEGAKNIPLDQVERRVKDFPKDKDIVLYCRSGARSGQALRLLESKGYDATKLHNLGPMSAW